ncbi:hypothetical protein AB0I85_13655 [Micromonospora echinofusca]|uniref:hypothetical protein n=1 Tax=Micromonospora echinofusca TaxID=47858 RepID=UPI0033E3C6CE
MPRLIGTLVTVALLPGVALTWRDLAADMLVEPVWPIWRSITPRLVPLWLVLLVVGPIVLARPQTLTAHVRDAGVAALETSPGTGRVG